MKSIILTTLLAVSVLSVGCAKKKASSASQNGTTNNSPFVTVPSGPYVPPGNGPGLGPGSNWEYGGTTDLTLTSVTALSQYAAETRYSPQDVKVNVNLVKYGNAYGGHVSIGYTDNGLDHEGYFSSGQTAEESKYNVFFNHNGQEVYHGFFEDFIGGVVLVIDSFQSLGDGDLGNATGSVWFKNFEITPITAPHPPTRCWFVWIGPYDCRAWKNGNGVNTTAALEPDNGYTKLGTFQNLNLTEAFNGQK